MRRAGSILCTTLAMSSFSAAQEQAYVQTLAEKSSYYVQEEITIRLRFGIEPSFLQNQLIQPFRRRLDLPVQIEATWLTTITGTAPVGPSFVLNGEHRIAEQLHDDSSFEAAQVETILRVAEPGELRLKAAVMRYAYADSFVEDLLGGRVPEGRHQSVSTGNELRLQIMPLPVAGRPLEFTGAVGEFSLRIEANPGTIEVGESFKLTLHLEGRGNLDSFDLPRLDRLTDFHLYGQIEERSAAGRKVTYDLAPLHAQVRVFPAIAFAYFDPNEPASYHRLLTEPIPLQVIASAERPVRVAPPTVDRSLPRENDIFDIRRVPTEVTLVQAGNIPPALLVLTLLAPWLLAAGFWSFRRVQARIRSRPALEPVRAEVTSFKQRIAAGNADLGDTLAAYFAARLGCQPAAIIAPDLDARLVAAGIPRELAARCVATLDDCVDARYGGREAGQDGSAVCALIDLCEEHFSSRRREA